MRALAWLALAVLVSTAAGCATVRPWQRGRLAGAAQQLDMDAYAEGQDHSIFEITERGTFASSGAGNAGAGCGCH